MSTEIFSAPPTVEPALARGAAATPLDLPDPANDNAAQHKIDPERYRARLRGVPGAEALSRCSAVVVGLGSLGSAIGAGLCRVGVAVHGCDPQRLEPENLIRWGLVVRPEEALGQHKAQVFRQLLEAAVPGARVEGHALDVVQDARAFAALLRFVKPDLLIVATDTRDSRRAVNALALEQRIPALFVALSDGAASARLELVEPPGPCHLCALAAEQPLALLRERASRRPYGVDTLEPAAVPALPADVAIAAALATRVALLRLSGQDVPGFLKNGEQRGNVAFFSLRPDHWVFDEAWQRLCYQVERRPYCPACGWEEDPRGAD